MPATATSKPRAPLVEEGMTPKKTALIIVTVIGCIAILWPKVFHPMMFGGVPPSQPNFKDPRAAPGGLRQERPAHLHPESIYQAMRERGRAIPATPTVPILERKTSPSNPPPRIVDGRPGPIPGMRPPMGAGALHQPQQRGSSMGFLMPLYTIGIVVFFGYTLMKIMFKKQVPNDPYGAAPPNPAFRQEVFGSQNHSQVEDLGGSKLGWREHQTRAATATAAAKKPAAKDTEKELYNASVSATEVASSLSASLKSHQQLKEAEQLMEIEKLRQKLESTERAMAQLVAEMNTDQYEAKKNDNEKTREQPLDKQNLSNGHASSTDQNPEQETVAKGARKRRDLSAEQELTVLGMELTASCEGGHKWTGRPPTPVFRAPSEHSKLEDNLPEPQSIYLEGALAHESQILVADSQIKREEVYDSELNGSAEEPAIILSSRMTLSLINLDANQQNGNAGKSAVESPLADDIEIIGHDEQ
uniref:RIC3 acetylcholine receptor chaperone, isoform J n=1 Tax=Drosophila melanogaster TaxID=7227 RepID=E1JGP5_DROME|nr:RIC3 acetylcholine receptor chaperone, isoform J [Drosophila melanogaster]NP_995910.2 RIC3 acetylcholine receptor chaperone, isoform R [Drosophila melanogaster]AAS64752.2 RIC3 acetylcholine receptor chaperone, isoform R [Drosophila melanogaster]ACZ94495.1 RIC3 acetylcholine receptor chaperone, isoform J [Drosophila melanogaster]|eukprot:NP_001163223.1 RIC3 acetylcholine receptor chaperone, isoform J [Drosophila melanogaster]